jgi:hypothetical protein
VQQLNINDYYEFGKEAESFETKLALFKEAVDLAAIAWPLATFRWRVGAILQEPCALLPSSQRAANAIIESITNVLPEDMGEVFNADYKPVSIEPYRLTWIRKAITDFETVLKNDMPEMSTFAVSQIGILRTDDLIRGAYRQIAKPLLPLLQDKARADIVEAGKCLAFRLSTASAFHACRAIETGIDQYYEALLGHAYEVSPNGGNNNWGAKTKALEDAGADEKVTEFLTHIRKQYRNPVTHPDVVVDEYEAVDLFIASLSAISMMLGATKAIVERNQPTFPGFAESLGQGLGGLYGTLGTGDSIRPSDEEDTLGLESGTPEETGSGEEGQTS